VDEKIGRKSNTIRSFFIEKGDEFRLTPEQQSVVAAWSVMKLMVSEYDEGANDPMQITVHHTHRKYMMKHKLPPKEGWGVWIGHYKRGNWPAFWVSHPFLILPDRLARKRPDKRATYYNGRVSTQVVGKLFIHIVHSPMPNMIRGMNFDKSPDGGVLYRIWPPVGHSIVWPSAALTDRDADFFAGALKEYFLFLQRKFKSAI
jgi:hypothetical protein